MKRSILIYAVLALYALGVLSGIWLIASHRYSGKKPGLFKEGIGLSQKDSIAIVRIAGPIRISQRPRNLLSYDSESITLNLRELAKRDEVKAVVLRINSPGGTVAAVQEIYSEIMKLRRKGKVVVASMGDVAASGGYYIAAACDKIVANPGTLTGSIGVILEIANVEELFKKIGVRIEAIKSGKYKDSGSAYRSITPEERQSFQELINEAYGQFVSDIAKGRKMDEKKVSALADGRVYTGNQALANGLVDALGNDEDAIELAAKLANIQGKPKILSDTQPWEKIFSLIGEQTGKTSLQEFTETVNNMRIRLEYILE
jgi:protease IV